MAFLSHSPGQSMQLWDAFHRHIALPQARVSPRGRGDPPSPPREVLGPAGRNGAALYPPGKGPSRGGGASPRAQWEGEAGAFTCCAL